MKEWTSIHPSYFDVTIWLFNGLPWKINMLKKQVNHLAIYGPSIPCLCNSHNQRALAPRSPGSATPSTAGTATCTVADGAHVENLRGETGGNSLGKWWESGLKRWGYDDHIWLWINTYENTIFRGMDIHFNPAIWMFTRGTRFWPIAIYDHIWPGACALWLKSRVRRGVLGKAEARVD